MKKTESMLARLKKFSKKRREQELEREKESIGQKIMSASQVFELQHVFEQSVKDADFSKMTVGIIVLIPGVAPLEYVLAKFFFPGKEGLKDLATSYSWDAFIRVVTDRLNDGKVPGDAQYGHIEYIQKDGLGFKEVTNQESFEVALNHLWHQRSDDEILGFQFRPESAEMQSQRLIGEVQNRPTTATTAEPETEEPIGSDTETTELPIQIEEQTGAPAAEKDEDTETAVAAEAANNRASSQTPPAVVERPSTSGTNVVAPGSLKRTKTTSKTLVKDAINKIRGKETAEQKRLRLATLWEAERTFYKKGDYAEEEDLTQVAEKDSEDGSISDEEDDEEDEISHEDRVVMKLQDMLNLPELSQLQDPNNPGDDTALWKECCLVFGIDPAKTGIDERVTIAGLKTPIYQYQAFGVYWQMTTSRLNGGGFVADDMGLGKTLSFLAYFVVERQLSVLWQSIDKSRAAKNGQHLPINNKDKNAKCPTPRKPGWILCPCTESSPTSGLPPKVGLRMACVPSALVRSWWEQWKTHVDTVPPELGLNIIVDHKGAFDNNTTAEEMNFRSDSGRSQQRSQAQRTKAKAGEGDDTAKPFQDGFLLLTTKETFPVWVKKYHSYDGKVRVEGTDKWKKGIRVQLVFGIAMIDECHEEAIRGAGRAGILLNLPRVNEPFLWGYSGTLFSMTPRGLEGVLWAIEKHTLGSIEKHPNYPQFSWATLDKICGDYANEKDLKKDTTSDDAIDAVLERFKPFLTNYVLRRDQQSKWFGHSLIKINPHVHQDIRLKQMLPIYTPQELVEFESGFQEEKDAMLLKMQQKFDAEKDTRSSNVRPTTLPFNTMCREQWRLSLLATFPWLLKLATSEDEKLKMNLTEIEALMLRGSDNKEKDNGYFRNIRGIVESSPKALWLYEFINGLDAQRDVNGDVQKLVIVTQFPQVAFILKLFIQVYFPEKKDRVGLVTGRMTLKEKSETLEAFTGKNKASKRDVQILIGTTRLLGVGLQLTRACNIILMEPDHHYVRELQSYARVHRIGQRNPFSYSYRLIDEASEIEARILKRQADRKEVPGKRITEEEVLQLFPAVERAENTAAEGVAGPSGTWRLL